VAAVDSGSLVLPTMLYVVTVLCKGMDGLVVFIDSCSDRDIMCDWKQSFQPAPIAPVVSDMLHATNQLNPLARAQAQHLVEELQHNPALIRRACSLMLRLRMKVADVLEEWCNHPNRHIDPFGMNCFPVSFIFS
jgi:hypothetical protein